MLRSLKEIEFDHAMRKTADADYEEMRDRLRVRAVGLMQQLDAAGYRAAIERDLAARAVPAAGDRGGARRRRLRTLPDGQRQRRALLQAVRRAARGSPLT